MKKILAFIRKDFLVDTSYSLSFLARWIGIVINVVMFYYLSRIVSTKDNQLLTFYGGHYFSFVLVGLALSSYFNSAMIGFSSTVSREQWGGTLEVLLTTPTRLSTLVSSFASYNLLMGFCAMGVYFGLGVFLGVDLSMGNMCSFITVMILSTFVFLSLGILTAAFTMVLRKGDPITGLVVNLFWLLGGTYFPISVFPEPLQRISWCLPSTYAVEALRLSLLKGYSLLDLKEDVLILLTFACCLGILSLWSFKYALWYAKKKGAIAFC